MPSVCCVVKVGPIAEELKGLPEEVGLVYDPLRA